MPNLVILALGWLLLAAPAWAQATAIAATAPAGGGQAPMPTAVYPAQYAMSIGRSSELIESAEKYA